MKILFRLNLLILSWIFTFSIQAQPANCIDFSEFESGAAFGQPHGNVPGEVIYSNQGTNLAIDQIFGINGGGSFGQMIVENDLGFGSEFPYLQLNGVTTAFELDGAANTVCFVTSNNGTAINFGINGTIGVFSSIADTSIINYFPDLDITISYVGNTPFDPVIVCISGVIEQFSIGGFGIFLDNVCTDYYPNPNCGFFGPYLDPYCSSAETINLSVNFDEIVGNNEFVDIFLDNEFYGFYPIASFPLNLENIPLAENQSVVEFRICINDNPDCCYTQSLELPDCMPASCVGFELYSDEMAAAFANNWPYDSIYHIENGISFTQRQMYRNGQLVAPNGLMLRLAPNAIPAFTNGSFITMGHVSTASQIDLSGYSEPVNSVRFDFYRFDDESYMNIGVNGLEVIELNGPFQGGIGTTTLADGTLRRIHYDALDPNMGTVEFFGQNITEIFFGGEGVAMDNLCFNQPTCEITNLFVGQSNCFNNEPFSYFFLDFDHNYASQDFFQLQVELENSTINLTYSYDDLPITGIELPGVEQEVIFTVTDGLNEDCSASFTTAINNCENACANFTASTVDIYCTDLSTYEVVVDISTVATNQIVLLRGLSNNITKTAILTNGSSVTFGFSDGENDPEGYTLIDGQSACEVYLPPFQVPFNNCTACVIEYATFTPTPCNADGFYSVVVEVFGVNFSEDYFISIGENQTFGPFQQSDFPVTVGELEGSPNNFSYVEVYSVSGDCYYAEDVFQNCDIINCNAFFPVLTAVECFDNNNLLVEVVIEGQTPDERFFLIEDINGGVLAEVPFTQNPISFTIPNNNTAGGAFIITDLSNNCQQVLQYETPSNCPPECDDIFNLLEVNCNNSGEIRVFFTAEGPEGETFNININDEVYTREYGNVEYVIELLPDPNQLSYTVYFWDELSGCEASFTFDNPCETCNNFFPFLLSVECTAPDTLIQLTILLDGSEADGREIHIRGSNGELYEELLFTQNPFTVFVPLSNTGLIYVEDITNGCEQALEYDIPADCFPNCANFNVDWTDFNCLESTNIELFFNLTGIEPNGQTLQVQSLTTGYTVNVSYTESILSVEWPLLDQGEIRITTSNGCTDITEYTTPEACINNCIGSFELVDVHCNPFDEIRISFTAQGPEGEAFTINANGISFTRFFGDFDYVIEIPSVDGQNEYELVFQDQVSGCVTIFNIANPCFCVIEDINYSIIECNEAGEWFLELSFFGGSTSDEDQFIVSAGGYTQSFPQGTSSTTIGPFTNSFNDLITLSIEAISGNCGESFTIEYGCEPQFCDINDLQVTSSSCDNAGNYFLDVYFEAEGAEFFEVSITNAGLSTIVIGSGQTTTFGPLNINEIQTSVILVEAINANCAAQYTYIQECEPLDDCNFTNVFAEAYDCDGDLFLVDVTFDNPNGGPLGFYIFGDGMIFGPYQYGENFYTFGPLNGTESEHDILILDIADPACFANYNLNYSCSDDCLIQELVLTPSACNDDGTFYVTVDVAGNNLGESFSVLGNGQNYGTFSYANLPIEVGPFDGDNETVYELGIIDLDNPNCAEWGTFGPVNCNPCDIRDFTYEVDCDNNSASYTLTIDFIYENPTSEFFALQIGGELYEWFSYESLPLTLTNIPYEFNGNTIRVEDSQEEICGETIDFDLPCCSMGNILNELEVEACLENGEYYLSINNFTGQNLTDSLVVDYAPAGTTIIATVVVAYGDLPAQIGPLVGDGSTGYLVVLSDQDNDCSVTTNIEPVFCDNGTCIEFEGENGVFGPNFGYDSSDEITTENEVAVTFERNPVSNCECNLFISDGIPGIDFGNGQIVATLNSGFGLDFTDVSFSFNTVNIDFYYPGGGLSMIVNGSDLITVNNLNDLPSSIAGIELQVITDPNNPSIGLFTFNGEIDNIQLFSNESAAFDNVCMSTDDNVWPGDTNTDNIASHFDLLNIGLTYGNTGPSRQEVTDEWTGLISANWGDNFADGVNHKHADANGDGIINEEDRLVLIDNYGLDHGPVSDFEALPYTDLDPPVFVDVSGIDDANPGSNIQIPVIVGSIDQEIVNIYGLAFTIQLDPELFDMSSIQVIYPTSWFGEPGVNTSSIERIYEDGRIEVAMTRIDHNNVSGFGEIMAIRVIIDDIAGIVDTPTDIVIEDVLAINYAEERSVLRPEMVQLMITGTTEEMDRDLLRSSFRIFPNPTQGLLHFRNQYGIAPDRVTITDAAGRLVANHKAPGMTVDLAPYPAGVYFLQIHLQGYIFTERVVKTE